MANVMLFYGFGKTLFHKCVGEEMCASPSESTAGAGGTPTGCKGVEIAFPQAEAWGYRYCSPSGAHTHADTLSLAASTAGIRCQNAHPRRLLARRLSPSPTLPTPGRTPTRAHSRWLAAIRCQGAPPRRHTAADSADGGMMSVCIGGDGEERRGIRRGRARRRCAVLLTPGFSPGKGDIKELRPVGAPPTLTPHAVGAETKRGMA